ncbi:MAG TPA: extracellular solute-binding protein [Roseiflexaceae bacterium]|nr:extracellular solute-binding protein [Roseiflexaceae bacterium]
MKRFKFLVALMTLMSLLLAACGTSTTTQPTAAPAGNATAAPAGDATAAPAGDATAAPATDATAATTPTDAPTSTEPTAAPTEPPVALGSGTTKIVVWHGWDGAYRDAIQQIFADYATKNNVTIELLKQSDLSNKAQVAVPSGQGPDVIAWVNDQIGKNALSGIIQPVDQFGITPDYLKENFTPVAADAMVYGGQAYGVPESMEALTFIYNKKLITEDKLPKSTDDLITQATEYNSANPGQYLFVYNAKNDAYFSAPWWQGAGVTLVTNEGTTELGGENAVKAGELIKSFTGIMPKEIDYNVADTLFKEGKAAIIMNGPWSIADYQKAGLDIGLATIPTVSSSGQPGRPFVGVKMLMLAANAKQPQAAADLMKYYGSAEVQAQLAEVNKQVPANTAAQEQVKADPIIAGFINQAANGQPMPNSEFIDAMWDPISKTVEAIWTGASEPTQAVQDGAALFEEKAQDLQ